MGYLVATDGSDVSSTAVAYAAAEACVWDRPLTIVHVLTPEPQLVEGELVLPGSDAAIESGHDTLAAAEALAIEAADAHDGDLTVSTELLAGWPAETITDYAVSNDVSGIVVGHRGRSEVAGDALGSVAKSVLDKADVPVTILK